MYNINVVCAYGGGNLYEQSKACEEGAEIIVATPVSVLFVVLFLTFISVGRNYFALNDPFP